MLPTEQEGPSAPGMSAQGGVDSEPSWLAAANTAKLQPRLLKAIMSLRTKQELLSYVERSVHLLDTINLVTCLYKLARMFAFVQPQAQRTVWRSELLSHASCTLLLGAIHSQLTQAYALISTNANPAVTGLNARCLSNLIWSLVKLECVSEDGHPLAPQVVSAASPLVLVFLEDCSGQGLANLLWSYAKMPVAHADVMTAIVMRMVQLLQDQSTAGCLDAQALSNSIWAIAHVRSRPNELDNTQAWQDGVTTFLLLMATQCLEMLNQLVSNQQPYAMTATASSAPCGDSRFSCQALVNIVWSLSTILGSACGVQDPVRPLFLLIRQLSIIKLQTSLGNSLQLHQPWIYSLSGTFHEQALANLIFAYDKAGLLDGALLQTVLNVATSRLDAAASMTAGVVHHGNMLPFKPQELCTLLRACHTQLANPLPFLSALNRLLSQWPLATSNFGGSEAVEVARAMDLVRKLLAEQEQQQQGQQHQVPQMASGTQVLGFPQAYVPQSASAPALLAVPATSTGLNTSQPVPSTRRPMQQHVWLYHSDSMLQVPAGQLVVGHAMPTAGPINTLPGRVNAPNLATHGHSSSVPLMPAHRLVPVLSQNFQSTLHRAAHSGLPRTVVPILAANTVPGNMLTYSYAGAPATLDLHGQTQLLPASSSMPVQMIPQHTTLADGNVQLAHNQLVVAAAQGMHAPSGTLAGAPILRLQPEQQQQRQQQEQQQQQYSPWPMQGRPHQNT